jgi:hypothetical protein
VFGVARLNCLVLRTGRENAKNRAVVSCAAEAFDTLNGHWLQSGRCHPTKTSSFMLVPAFAACCDCKYQWWSNEITGNNCPL